MTETPALPPTTAPAAIESMSSLEVASTVTSPPAVACTKSPIHASVCLFGTSMSAPTPTPALAADRERAGDAEDRRVVGCRDRDLAARRDDGVIVDVRRCVVSESTSIVAEPAMPTLPPTEPPTATSLMSSLWKAETVRPPGPASIVS